MDGTVTIICFNTNASSIVSAAGRISTIPGSADQIYRDSLGQEEEKNIRLIGKILSSGHESVLEHISFNLSFNDVSVSVEQFMIEFRLASFTVKSRRYVDFGKMGYVVPDFSVYGGQEKSLRDTYQAHMEYLFDEYNSLVQRGVPKEDARFVLPYSFKSNFYCTVNARELIKIMNEMVYGRGRDFPELVELGRSLFRQCEEKAPYLAIRKPQRDGREKLRERLEKRGLVKGEGFKEEGFVTFLQGSEAPEEMICRAAALHAGIVPEEGAWRADLQMQREILAEVMKSTRRRELEQVNVTFRFNRMSLACVTHLVRHRMQAIVVPDYIEACNFGDYVLPGSIVDLGFEEEYRGVFKKGKEMCDYLVREGLRRADRMYLLLSGLTIPVMTTMNANELYVFLKLRTCNRAQWEIKECSDALLRLLREKYPVLFSFFGPSCYAEGKCPEGKMSCGRMQEMLRAYGG